jgi:hypothetical protein
VELYGRWELASRSLPAGAGFKPPSAAAFKRRGGERLGKRRYKNVRCVTKKMSASEPSMTHRKTLYKIVKTEGDEFPQDKSERNLFTVQAAIGVKAA